MQNVLVAGGAGFIGSHLCEVLLLSDYKVICVDNLLTGDKNNIARLVSNPQFSFIQADISKAEKLLGWSPVVSLQVGLEKTIAYFKTL